jgi:hypothetical protein
MKPLYFTRCTLIREVYTTEQFNMQMHPSKIRSQARMSMTGEVDNVKSAQVRLITSLHLPDLASTCSIYF